MVRVVNQIQAKMCLEIVVTHDAATFHKENVMNKALLISVSELSKILGIGRTKAYELIGNGDIESVQIGNRRLISVKSVKTYVKSLREGEKA